jgi:membrane protein DedA with SNARE-associated domain
VSNILGHILSAPSVVVYAIVGFFVFAEDALFVGFVLPGETAAILGGVAASQHHAHLAVILVIVVAAAIVGDTVGYEVGRHFGDRVLSIRILQRHRHRLADAQDLLARRGGWAVFVGRFTAFFRAVMPALAGTARMPYPRFLAFNAAGGVVWGTGAVMVGYLASNSYLTVEKTIGRGVAAAVAAIALIALIVWIIRRRRAEAALEALPDKTADA